AGKAHEPWASDGETETFDVPLREVRPFRQHPLVGSTAGPVHLVVDPAIQTEAVGLVGRNLDPLEVPLGQVRHLEPVPAVQDHAVHPLLSELPELEAHLVRVELAIQEPEGEDAELPRGLTEAVEVQPVPGHDICTVAFTNPSGFSRAVRNAFSMSSSGKVCVTMPSMDRRPETRSRIPARIPRMMVGTSRKWALTMR